MPRGLYNKLTPEQIQKRISGDPRGYISLDFSTYVHMNYKSKWIDSEYGEWWATPNKVLNSKQNHPLRGHKLTNSKQTADIKKIQKQLKKDCRKYISLDVLTYTGMQKKAKFIDSECGEWWVTPYNVLITKTDHPNRSKEKINKTCLDKYGCSSPFQNKEIQEKCKKSILKKYGVDNVNKVKEISLKAAKSLNSSKILFHWKTGEELICIASYEIKVINWLNNNKINYLWQPQVFIMPDGHTYRPDLFLIKEDKWIEIKGYIREPFKPKWFWFIAQYPTAELWTKDVLKSKGIL